MKTAEARIQAAAAAAQRAREESARDEEKRLAVALSAMRKSHDDVRGVTWYTHKSVPVAQSEDRRPFLYIGKNDNGGAPWMRFVIRYSADDWLFIERYIIKADETAHTLIPEDYGPDAVERDNGYGSVWEWWDVKAATEEMAVVEAILNSKSAILRYEGKQYYRDRTITGTERLALRQTLDAFDVLSNGGR